MEKNRLEIHTQRGIQFAKSGQVVAELSSSGHGQQQTRFSTSSSDLQQKAGNTDIRSANARLASIRVLTSAILMNRPLRFCFTSK